MATLRPVGSSRRVRPWPRRWPAWLLLAPAMALPGCASHITISVPQYVVSSAAGSGHLIAGVARIDITPPSGYPMGGHGLGGRFSRGHWGRLYARAFYLRDANGSSVAIVSTDLWGIPAGLHETVAQLANAGLPSAVSQTARELEILGNAGTVDRCPTLTPHADIGRRNLLLEATHAHLGPGNYLSSEFFNAFTSQYPGFDRRQFDFLSFRIACAVALAADDAKLHSGDAATLLWTSTPRLPDLVRNREIVPLRKDDKDLRARLMQLGPNTIGCPMVDLNPAPHCLRDRAVDATLTRLTVKRGADDIGALVFFAAHPLALSDHVAVNSPDFTGFAMGNVERELSLPGKPRFIAGFFNGAEGDVTPRWDRQDAADALALAARLSSAAVNAVTNPVSENTLVSVSAQRFTKTQKGFCGGSLPLLGVATMGGAEDGRSVWFDTGWRSDERSAEKRKYPFREGLWRSLRDLFLPAPIDQDPKKPALDLPGLSGLGVTGIVGNPKKFPKDVPASLFKIGSRWIAAVPFEMTSAAGLWLKEKLSLPDPILVVGPANEYLSYMTTREEYDDQEYEGSSTLFGFKSAECLSDLLTSTPVPDGTVAAHQFDAGPPPIFDAVLGPEFWGRNGQFQDASLESPFLPETRTADRLPRFEWDHCHEDDRIELWSDAAGPWKPETDDEEGQLLVELVEGREVPTPTPLRHRRWAALWLADKSEDPSRRHMFRVTPRSYADSSPGHCDSTPICSLPFTLGGLAAMPPGVILPADCPP